MSLAQSMLVGSAPCQIKQSTTSHLGSTKTLCRPAGARHSKRQSISKVVRATAETEQRNKLDDKESEELKKLSAKLGLPTDEGLFGFKPFAEVWVGRLAMGGFISSCMVEFITGKGTLQQVGLVTPSFALFSTILILAGVATSIGSWRTILRASNNELTANELVRYRQLLGIQNEEKNIAELRKKGSVADKFLGSSDSTNAQSTTGEAREAEASDGASKGEGAPKYTSSDIVTDPNFKNEGLAYARDVEVNNGRAAMIGFLSAILVEAATGNGIIGQVVTYCKASGLLGEKSGF